MFISSTLIKLRFYKCCHPCFFTFEQFVFIFKICYPYTKKYCAKTAYRKKCHINYVDICNFKKQIFSVVVVVSRNLQFKMLTFLGEVPLRVQVLSTNFKLYVLELGYPTDIHDSTCVCPKCAQNELSLFIGKVIPPYSYSRCYAPNITAVGTIFNASSIKNIVYTANLIIIQ